MSKRKPYDRRTDLEKLQSQWNKLSGLHTNEEWSAAVVRAATAAEIAANLAVREEFGNQSKFSAEFIDTMLRWANGLDGKISRLLLPLSAGKKHHETINGLKQVSKTINDVRNRIVHRGEFCSRKKANDTIEETRAFVVTLVRIYHRTFELVDKKH